MVTARRLFVGIDFDDATRSLLAQMLAPIGPLPGRLLPPENWHITVRFLGSVDQVTTDRLLAALDGQRWPRCFRLVLSGLGAFPKPRKATVLWLGVQSSALDELALRTEEVVTSIGFAPEERPFHAHLTLSRIRPPTDVRPLLEADWGRLVVPVTELSLFESHNDDGGSRYEVVDRFPLPP